MNSGRVTVTLSRALVDRIVNIRQQYNVSVSGLIEAALTEYLDRMSPQQLAEKLRESSATLRRKFR